MLGASLEDKALVSDSFQVIHEEEWINFKNKKELKRVLKS